MAFLDVFNGDADGICSLVQLRCAQPRGARLVTGLKRDIALVAKAAAGPGDELTVLDVSFDTNREAVLEALARGASIFYADHHFAGEIPSHPALSAHIDTSADVCTSLIVNRFLNGRFAAWAVAGAFGDNLDASASRLAGEIGLEPTEQDALRRLGICINYNGYGASLADLHFAPDALFERLRPFADPREFLAADPATFAELESGYRDDLAAAAGSKSLLSTEKSAVFLLPDEAWARRVSGVFGNDLANASPDRAHAVVTERADGSYLVSVRAPLRRKSGADELCRRFPTGGGRAAAAGINALPGEMLDSFVAAFGEFFGA
ncbi:MAG: DHH family phosphoesterase [Planctomycetota bacterium]